MNKNKEFSDDFSILKVSKEKENGNQEAEFRSKILAGVDFAELVKEEQADEGLTTVEVMEYSLEMVIAKPVKKENGGLDGICGGVGTVKYVTIATGVVKKEGVEMRGRGEEEAADSLVGVRIFGLK